MSIPGIKEFAGMDVGFSNCWSAGIETASFTPSVPEATRIPTTYRSSIKHSLACGCEKLESFGVVKKQEVGRKRVSKNIYVTPQNIQIDETCFDVFKKCVYSRMFCFSNIS